MTKPTMPAGLTDNPRLGRWVSFAAEGRVLISTGKVEIGQGILTAMLQIAAEELDVAPSRIVLRSGDTTLTPNEGNTSGSLSVQNGGAAMRAACAEVRGLFLEHAASRFGHALETLGVTDGTITLGGVPTEHSYWSLAGAVDLDREATGGARPKPVADYRIVGTDMERVDLAEKIFGQPVFIHDMKLDFMRHARVLRRPQRQASLAAVDEEAIRKAAKGPIEFIRHGNFLAIVGDDEDVVEAAAAKAATHVTWDGIEPLAPFQAEAKWLLQRPSVDRLIGEPEDAAKLRGLKTHEATYTKPHLAHASIAPSCGLALYKDGKLRVWSHTQGVFPLRGALCRATKLPPEAITVTHVQGAGCYGHNGADDAAADAALIAVLSPGRPVRVRWRREEEFAFEPVAPAMNVKIRAALDEDGKPVDWTTEIWSGPHNNRPGRAGRLLIEDELPDAPPFALPQRPEGEEGGTRNGKPLYAIPATRILHHFIPETPVRTSALRGLGAMANVFAIECFVDELAEAAGADPVAYRLSLLSDPRAAKVVRRVAEMCGWQENAEAGSGRAQGIGFARYKNSAAYSAVVVELAVDEDIRLIRAWCATDGGLIINPDGAINQLEGGIIQSASWVLKEQVRLEGDGVASLDWERYPVLRFDEVPDVFVELVEPKADRPPLGIGEATAGPTAAAIGNAVAKALGARIRDLPLTREKIVATLLAG
jgi:CO/xanthine dehydrogenase Mo-binding subunit